MVKYHEELKREEGFSLVEVLVSIFIISIVVASASAAFIFSTKSSNENELRMHALNIANETIESIRSLNFADVGTKMRHPSGVIVYGDPPGEILQEETVSRGGLNYLVKVNINWEEEAEWDLSGNAQWDYKSVRVSVTPLGDSSYHNLEQTIETYVTRDSSQPALSGSNIRVRCIRGWNTGGDIQVVQGVNAELKRGSSLLRFVSTSSKGIASFLGLNPGEYTVVVNPGARGYMLHPSESENIDFDLENGKTKSVELTLELPCSLRFILKDINSNPITSSRLPSGSKGRISILHPYPAGTTVHTDFDRVDINGEGRLSTVVNNLWPVGDGYAGRYLISDVAIENYQFLSAYINNRGSEVLWDGGFDNPGTEKVIILYFNTIPQTPAGISTSWVSGTQIESGTHRAEVSTNGHMRPLEAGVLKSSNSQDTLVLRENRTSEFYGKKIFIENKGRNSNYALVLKRRSELKLHGRDIVFRGSVNIESAATPNSNAEISLYVDTIWDTDSAIYGSGINDDNAEDSVLYGKLYLTKPLYLDDNILVDAGGYYFPHGTVLPRDINKLIPFTKENYVD